MRSIVITGSTRGIGHGMAGAFLERGCAVTVSGRTPQGVAQAVDIWINNAAITHPSVPFWTHPPLRAAAVVETNLLGAMYGAAVAIPGTARCTISRGWAAPGARPTG